MKTRSIAEFTTAGIQDLGDLHEALHLAMRLEFATIPPYLCAQWSIITDPDRVEGVLHRIVSQEMQHLALAGNLLTAIGGRPHIASPRFMTVYPTKTLPGGIELADPLDLCPLTATQLSVFMDIEKPEFAPVALLKRREPTIGAFYDTIIEGLSLIRPAIDQDALAIPVRFAPKITSIEEAIATIEIIKREGEGVEGSPEQPETERDAYAHYYQFKEIAVGQRLVFTNGKWSFNGRPVVMPAVVDFRPEGLPSTGNIEFREVLRRLLMEIEACWILGRAFEVSTMFELGILGRSLTRKGVTPSFEWPQVREQTDTGAR
jgi:hypothetical protein